MASEFYASVFGTEFVDPPLAMFWGGYYATVLDRFGIRWMFNCPEVVD